MSASRATSERLLTIPRPRFEVAGTELQRVAEDMIRLDVWDDEEGIARLELRLLNWDARDDGDDPGFTWFDKDVLDFGTELAVLAGDGDNAAEIFHGKVTAFEAVFDARRRPEIVVRAEDALMWLRMTQKSASYQSKTDATIASDVAGELGMQVDQQADGPTHTELLRVNTSPLAFLRERARAVDARVGLSRDQNGQSKLVFRPRRESGGADPIALSRAGEIISFEVSADLAHQRSAVEVHGWSVSDKDGIHERAEAGVLSGEKGSGKSGPDLLGDLSIDATEHLHLEQPVTTDEARRMAEAHLRRRARSFVSGRITTDGTPRLKVGSRVDVRDAGPWFDGEYHVAAVHHGWDQTEGLRTHLAVERVGVGRGT